MEHGSPVVDTSVAGVVEARWGVRPEPAIARYAEPGWQLSPVPIDRRCPKCEGELHGLYRAHPDRGRQQLQAAVACPTCPASFTLRELKLAQRSVLGDLRPDAVSRRLAEDAQLEALARSSRAGRRTAATSPGPATRPRAGTGDRLSGQPASGRPSSGRPSSGRRSEPEVRADASAEPEPRTGAAAGAPPSRIDGEPVPEAGHEAQSRGRTSAGRQSRVTGGRTAAKARAGAEVGTGPRIAAAGGGPAAEARTEAAEHEPRIAAANGGSGAKARAGTVEREPHVAAAGGGPEAKARTGTDEREPQVAAGGVGRRARAGEAEEQVTPAVDVPEHQPRRRVSTVAMAARIRSILSGSEVAPVARSVGVPVLPPALAALESRPVWWCKTVDPGFEVPEVPAGVDARVVLPDLSEFDGVRARLEEAGVPYRAVRHWLEQEEVSAAAATAWLSDVGGVVPERCESVVGEGARAARLAFEVLWDLHEPADDVPDPVPITRFVPDDWARFLPFPVLNPAQAQAAPHLVDGDSHVLITAPTGAGKTAMGMLAVLKAILHEGRKAAWLVPQRSLTDELDRELETWRDEGLRVERLSGEYAVDVEAVKAADLWVATTEKFEAICRAGSLQAALGEVGCLVVDEIHLLGSPNRGALLEALLARVRGTDSPVRIVGLSATVSNAAEVAEWLEADLVATTWRPSTVTWQLPTIPAASGFTANNRLREQVVLDLTHRHTAEGGSVLVFCGSKRNVRSTAMAIAADRGAPVHTVAPDDVDGLTKACAEVGVRLHYADYEHKHAAERAFRAREADVLVATSTVAAGVNLPARAVIIRDVSIGGEPIDTSTVLQMFGRAGRIGAGETEGWSYLIVDETQRADWQTRLVAGYSVYSRIRDSLPDHVLAEVLQGRIGTMDDAQAWWVETLAHAQGDDDLEPVQEAVQFLVDEGHLTSTDGRLAITELGRLTARMMVSTHTGHRLRRTLGLLPVPRDPDEAENALSLVLSVAVRDLAGIPVPEPVRPAVATVIKAGGKTSQITNTTSVKGLGSQTTTAPGDLAWAALLLAARSPHLFDSKRRVAGGIPMSTLHPVYEQAPRFLAWLAAQGVLGTVHPWIAVVAADLDHRVRWRSLAPGRGAGRLLWMCEEMATRAHLRDVVPGLWRSAVARGVRSPDWPPGRSPAGCVLDHAGYTALLRERTTNHTVTAHADNATVTGGTGTGATAIAWRGRTWSTPTTAATIAYPSSDDDDETVGVAVFTRRGDYRATGWLDAYSSLDTTTTDHTPPPPKRTRRGLGSAR
ncbi:helicase-like protein [Saccharothrix carnea]|uniref:Helicase-like protein n=1 Tax=Saccharothrix carnea TaxID=1280637 RepID=A0A2P8ICE4_SACCR|nr:DEAD/DEAH box helicase [Saccharothrix carnea]PSL56135.1 helicase-like protein [Saccharothrix carnea]